MKQQVVVTESRDTDVISEFCIGNIVMSGTTVLLVTKVGNNHFEGVVLKAISTFTGRHLVGQAIENYKPYTGKITFDCSLYQDQ